MKRKKTYIFLLLICFLTSILVFPVSATSQEGTFGDGLKWKFDVDSGTLTIGGKGTATDLSINSNYGSFEFRDDIRHLVFEEGIDTIGERAYSNVHRLESIWISDSVKTIEDGAFANCFNVKQIHFGKNVTTIGESAFATMGELESLILPPSVRSIGVEAFALSGISELVIPEGVTELNGSSFRSNKNLTRVFIPASVTKIQCSAFRDCAKLTDIYFGGTQEQWDAIDFQHKEGSHGGDTKILGNAVLLSATKHYNQTGSWEENVDDSATEPEVIPTEQTLATEPAAQPTETKAETAPTTQTAPQDDATKPAETLPDTGDPKEEKPNNVLWIAVGTGIAAALLGGSAAFWFCLRKNKK